MSKDSEYITPTPPRGMRDHLPEQLQPRLKIIEKMRRIFELYGFQPLGTPAMERLEVLTGKYGEESDKLIYRVLKRGDDLKRSLEEIRALNPEISADIDELHQSINRNASDLGLRYDLTVSLARVVAQHGDKLPKPFKRYQIAPVWRADRPQRGRYREFIQCDIDIVGTDSMVADAEIILLVIDVLQDLNLPAFDVLVNHRGLLKSLSASCGNAADKFTDFCTALDKLDKIGKDGVEEEMKQRRLSTGRLGQLWELAEFRCYINVSDELVHLFRKLREFIGNDESDNTHLQQLEELFRLLNGLGVSANIVKFDPTLARGLDYYTGPVFEIYGHDKSLGSLGGGGRYDELIGMFSKQEIPATGTSFGLERIADVMVEKGIIESKQAAVEVMVIDVDKSDYSIEYCGMILKALKRDGISCELNYDRGRKLGKQIKTADKRKVPFIIFAGEGEAATGILRKRHLSKKFEPNDMPVNIKRLIDGDERKSITLHDCIEWIKKSRKNV